ncbi:hypothetical protein, partial [Streptomyces sp. NPDC004976]
QPAAAARASTDRPRRQAFSAENRTIKKRSELGKRREIGRNFLSKIVSQPRAQLSFLRARTETGRE